ncbi:MAG: type II toxin-antitoxin system prevent-host-death family antitoxin [Vicinamibacterales bacterium]
MATSINAKTLRGSLPDVVRRAQKGERFTVIYRSRPAFKIVPLDEAEHAMPPLEEDPLYQAEALGSSSDGRTAADHDELLYPK